MSPRARAVEIEHGTGHRHHRDHHSAPAGRRPGPDTARAAGGVRGPAATSSGAATTAAATSSTGPRSPAVAARPAPSQRRPRPDPGQQRHPVPDRHEEPGTQQQRRRADGDQQQRRRAAVRGPAPPTRRPPGPRGRAASRSSISSVRATAARPGSAVRQPAAAGDARPGVVGGRDGGIGSLPSRIASSGSAPRPGPARAARRRGGPGRQGEGRSAPPPRRRGPPPAAATKIRRSRGHPDRAEQRRDQQRRRAGQQLRRADPAQPGSRDRVAEVTSRAPPANAYGSA